MVKTIGDVCKLKSGISLSSDNLVEKDGYPYIKVADMNLPENSKCIQVAREYVTEKIDKRMLFPAGTVLFPKRGGAIGTNKKRLTKCEVCADLNIMGVIPGKELVPLYLYYFFQQIDLGILYNGSSVPQINNKDIVPLRINVLSIEEQNQIIDIIQKVDRIIAIRQRQLDQLDMLIKARFVEMFGDVEINNLGLPTRPMTDICEIIDGDRGENYPTQDEFSDEGYCLFLNAKNVTADGFSFDACMFVTKEKDEIMRKGHLNRGDIVLTTRGTIGNLAFYDNTVPFENVRINSGMVILRMNHDIISERFFIEQFKMQLASIKEKNASGSAQPQLPISTMNKIIVLMPEIKLQKRFVAFVESVDKSRVAIQKSLDETQLLFDSLMQKYFG